MVWLLLAVVSGSSLVVAQGDGTPGVVQDTLLITPVTQGRYTLPDTGVTLDIGYGSVRSATRLTVTRAPESSIEVPVRIDAVSGEGVPLAYFEMPLLVSWPGLTDGVRIVGWPGAVEPWPDGPWLVVFDAHGLYARPATDPTTATTLYLGPLEHFSPDLLAQDGAALAPAYTQSAPRDRAILWRHSVGDREVVTPLPTAARALRYRDRFLPEDLGNAGGFMLMGMVPAEALPELARALRATVPADPDLPAPGEPAAPLRLLLPFDCAWDWVITWGYHQATPQNRYAVDFAVSSPPGTQGQPVYAAHEGVVFLKRYGTPDHLIDVGLAARVVAPDGVTSTVTGHLNEAATLAWWKMDAAALPDFTWVEVGRVAAGEVIGVAGSTGYATGPHVHFVLWSWDQSLYQPVPLGPLAHFERGQVIPRGSRPDCDHYHR